MTDSIKIHVNTTLDTEFACTVTVYDDVIEMEIHKVSRNDWITLRNHVQKLSDSCPESFLSMTGEKHWLVLNTEQIKMYFGDKNINDLLNAVFTKSINNSS